MSSTCVKPEGLYSGRQLHVQIIPWYNMFINNYTIPVHTTIFLKMKKYKLYHTCTYNRIPEDEEVQIIPYLYIQPYFWRWRSTKVCTPVHTTVCQKMNPRVQNM